MWRGLKAGDSASAFAAVSCGKGEIVSFSAVAFGCYFFSVAAHTILVHRAALARRRGMAY